MATRIVSAIVLAIGLMVGPMSLAQTKIGKESDLDGSEPLDQATLDGLKVLYKQLIDAENRHDLDAVKPMMWRSPSTLFVAKTAPTDKDNWSGFWGTDVVLQHFGDLYKGTFRMDPDYSKEKVVGLSTDVAETYVPIKISVAYAGQTPVPKPFLMIVEWVRTHDGWKMATDIALPIPPPPRPDTVLSTPVVR